MADTWQHRMLAAVFEKGFGGNKDEPFAGLSRRRAGGVTPFRTARPDFAVFQPEGVPRLAHDHEHGDGHEGEHERMLEPEGHRS